MMTKRNQTPGNKAPVKLTAKPKRPTTKAASKTTPVAKKAASKKRAQAKLVEKDREQLVAEAAYLIAQQRGFNGDCALDDWLQAEAQIDMKLFS